MKRIKTAVLLILCLFSSMIFYACDKTIKVEKITLSESEIVLRVNNGEPESKILEATVTPNNATNKKVNFVLTDTSCASLTVDPENNNKVTITASSEIIGPVSTFVQAISEDGSVRSEAIKITIYTEITPLLAPQNLEYDPLTQLVEWDNIDSASGYKLQITVEGEDPEEIYCPQNLYEIAPYYNKIISVKVKAVGDGTIYSDSEYGTKTLNFVQPEEPKNLRNEGETVKFSPVENAESYKLYVYQISQLIKTESIDATLYTEENGFYVEELENVGSYVVKVQTIAKNENPDVINYPSKMDNSITITKIETPEVNTQDFMFTYSNKTLSWNAYANADGYKVIRKLVGGSNSDNKTYELNKDTTTLVLDTEDDKLVAGKYTYSLKVLGNNKEFLDSGTSESILIEKLSAPNLKVEKGNLAWNSVENIGGYVLKIDDNKAVTLSTETLSYELGLDYSAKEYNFVISASGNGVNTLTSEPSSVFNATKLQSPFKAYVDVNNTDLILKSVSYVESLQVYLTREQTALDKISKVDLTLDNEDNLKVSSLDMSNESYLSGNYRVYTVAFADGYLKSNPSETYEFKKLSNENKFSISNGELQFNLVEDAVKAEIYIDGNEDSKVEVDGSLENLDISSFIAGQTYRLQAKFIPEVNKNLIVSNYSESFEVSKLIAPNRLYVEDGEVKFDTEQSYTNIFYVTEYTIKEDKTEEEKETSIYYPLSNLTLEENKTYKIKMCHMGNSEYLNSDFSNEIRVELLDRIDTLQLSGDILSFDTINAAKYSIMLKNNTSNEGFGYVLDEDVLSVSLQQYVKQCYPDSYNSLEDELELYIISYGESCYTQTSTPIKLSRELYGGSLNNNSNSIFVKILPSPTNFRVTKLFDLVANHTLGLGKMYFECLPNATLFELTYTNTQTNITSSKLVSVGNGLIKAGTTVDGLALYNVDTTFLSAGNYNFNMRSVSASEVATIPGLSNRNVYNINGFDTASINAMEKLSEVENIQVSMGSVKIEDSDTNYVYLYIVNGEIIYDDILKENQTLDYILGLAQSNPTEALAIVNKFKEKTGRTLPKRFKGTFNLSCYKLSVPTGNNVAEMLLNLTTETPKIASNAIEYKEVTRLDTPKLIAKNGVLEIAPVNNAVYYGIYKVSKTENGYDIPDSIVKEINNSEDLKYDAYSLLTSNSQKGVGEHYYAVKANVLAENYINSLHSNIVGFEILKAPTLSVNNGALVWNGISLAKGYKITVKNAVTDFSFEVEKNVLSYDAFKKANGNVLEGGNYSFTITALGELNSKEETIVLSSVVSSTFEATKLNNPQDIRISGGKLIFTNVDSHTGVEYYKIYVNSEEEMVVFNGSVLDYELPEKYLSGNYTISYQAIAGNTNYLTSNISNSIKAEKLNQTTEIYVNYGEINWKEVSVNSDYNNEVNGNVVSYDVYVQKEGWQNDFTTTENVYEISKDTRVEGGKLYTIKVKTIGDSSYYLNSNNAILQNVGKLDNIKDLKIEGGKLVWTSPNIVEATNNGTLASPNGLRFTFTYEERENEIILENGVKSFELDSNFAAGRYQLRVQNIGDKEQGNNQHFVNSEIVQYYTMNNEIQNFNLFKLETLKELNIKDGINLAWTDDNVYSTYKYLVNLTQNINEEAYTYEGVVETFTSSIEFTSLAYYINQFDEKILVSLNDENIEYTLGIPYFKVDENTKFEVKKFNYSNSTFNVNVKAYGDASYITSNASNTITIVMPDPITNLNVEHGRITWDYPEDINGFILTLTRSKNGIQDENYNEYNKMIYLTGQTYYNLSDVNYNYVISIKTYSVISSNDANTMASEPVTKEYSFNDTFTNGAGTDANPYVINSENDLKLMKYNNLATYLIDNDITLSNSFEPLFTKENPFLGKLITNGTTRKISNLKINTYHEYTGLLGYLDTKEILDDRVLSQLVDGIEQDVRVKITTQYTSEIKNINFENVDITEGRYVGAIAGYNKGVISNVIVSGKVNSSSQIQADVGASYNNIYSGSIVAINSGKIEYSVSTAEVNPTSLKSAKISGGIVSENTEEGIIYFAQSNGKITGTIVGGISAINSGKIEGSTSTGDIICLSLTNAVAYAGGIVAQNKESGKIYNCLVNNANFGAPKGGIINSSTESVATTSYIGGLVGENAGECYNNIVKVELYIDNPSVNAQAGKIFGYNANNTVKYNYALIGVLGNADKIQANGKAIDGDTNAAVENFDNIVAELNINNNNTQNEFANNKISWEIENNNVIIKEI